MTTFEAGFKAGIEAAAKVADEFHPDVKWANIIAVAIRDLAPPSDMVAAPTPRMVEILRGFIGDYTDRPIHGLEKVIRAMLAAHKEGQ